MWRCTTRAGERIAECDQALEQHLKGIADKVADSATDGEPVPTAPRESRRSGPKRRRKAGSHAPQFDLGRELSRVGGVDLTRIDGIDVGVAQTVISEVGVDMTRWKTEAHFASWLGLCPDNRIHRRQGDPQRHPARRQSSRDRLTAGGHYIAEEPELPWRAIPPASGADSGTPKAITAMAHKLARLIYRLLKWGHAYVDKGLHIRGTTWEQQVHLLQKRAAKLGLQLVALEGV